MPKTETQVNAFAESFHNAVFSKDVPMNTALIKHE